MYKEYTDKPPIFHCKKCGWNIFSSKIKEIYGENDGNYFCYKCGSNLMRSFYDNEYNLDFLKHSESLYEDQGSIRAVCRKLENDGYHIERRKLKRNLENKFQQEGRDFNKWFNKYKKYQRGFHYKDSEVNVWISMYEKVGSFLEISRILANNNKKSPDYKTIAIRIKEKLVSEGRDFGSWKAYFKRVNPNYFLPNYNFSDAKEWKKLYEQWGSYRAVEKVISIDHHVLKNHIFQLANKEGWDFDEWEEKYSKGRFKYDKSDLELWIKLFEEFGSFLAISNFLNRNTGQSPDSKNIKRRLKEEFQFRGLDFDMWVEDNKKVGLYSNEEVKEWKSLYEELGNFTAVSDYLEENFGEGPDPTTIKNRMKSLFQEKGWKFKSWVIKFYNDNSERHYLIGKYIHWILEYIFIDYTLNHDIKGYFEVMPNRFNGSLTSVDNVIIKSSFDIINIDYTISTKKRVFYHKCKKGYQSLNRQLIIVALNIDESEAILKKNVIPYKKNVKIMNAKKFCRYMKYYGNYLENFYDAIGTMKEAFSDDFFLIKLEKIAKEARIELEKLAAIYPISQENYELDISWWKNY
ncbi:MAG: hypothetical protein ACFFBY_14035 [Promethearchaeota archaeon]